MKTLVAAMLVAALIAPGAMAQPVARGDDPEATLLSDLVVVGPANGPAWWRVSKGDAVVWIMGLPASSTPRRQVWDKSTLERRLKGAKALLLPPRAKVTVGRHEYVRGTRPPPGVQQTTRDREDATIRETVHPALAARYAAARARIWKRYGGDFTLSPAEAFLKLYLDFHASGRLDLGGNVTTTATTAARQDGVEVFQPASLGDLKLDEAAPSRPGADACFAAMLDSVEVPMARYRAVAEGWARGDLVVATSGPREALGICENQLFNQGASRRAIEVQVAGVEAALETPGKTVALANLRSLLAEEGIIARLAAKGYHIVYPTSLDANAG
jgi:hypothetical protein